MLRNYRLLIYKVPKGLPRRGRHLAPIARLMIFINPYAKHLITEMYAGQARILCMLTPRKVFATAKFKLAAIIPIGSDLGLGRSYDLIRNTIRLLSWLSALHSGPMVGPET